MTTLRSFLTASLSRVYRRAEKIAFEEWARRNIVLGSKESIDNPGAYDPSHSYYAPRLFDVFMTGHEWRTLSIMKSSQSGITLHALILIARVLAEAPTNILYVLDTKSKSTDLSKNRLQPLLKGCRAFTDTFAESEDEMNNLSYSFPGCTLGLRGAGTAGQVASDPIGLAIGDEVDKWPDQKVESHIWDLLVNRIKRSEFGKAIGFSSPTVEVGKINRQFEAGSRHKYHVHCPHCQTAQHLVWEGVRYQHCKDLTGRIDLREVLAHTHYECSNCKGKIEEDDKPAMMAGGKWQPTNFRQELIAGNLTDQPIWMPGEMSAHISDLYSIHPESTWGKLAVEWIRAQGDPVKLHDFMNGRLGLPIRQSVSNVTERHVLRLRGEYQKGTLPVIPAMAVMAIDNQGDHQKYVRGAFDDNGDLYVIDWGRTLTLDESDDLAATPIPRPDGESFVQRVIIDEGGKGGTSYEVRKFCQPRFPKFFPAKGRGGLQVKNTISWSTSSIDRGGMDSIPVCHFDDDAFKRVLYLDRIKKFDPVKCEAYGEPRLWIPKNIDEQFIRELCGEHLVKRLDKFGKTEFVWEPSPPNDYGDCVKMLYVLWNIVGAQLQSP
jgi:phage terminase large subunit GpA-like protein